MHYVWKELEERKVKYYFSCLSCHKYVIFKVYFDGEIKKESLHDTKLPFSHCTGLDIKL